MKGISRREFLKCGAAGATFASLPYVRAAHAAMPVAPINANRLRKYVQPLPVPGNGIVVATPVAANSYAFTQRAIARTLHPDLPQTPLWAYDDGSGLAGQAGSFGMAVIAQTGTPVRMQFTSALPSQYPSWIPVDPNLTPLGSEVRVMTHLHGGFVAAENDGNPAETPNGFGTGEIQTVEYPNQAPQQPASLLWFHDHGLGVTRLNVFAGLAAAYLLRDETDTGLPGNVNQLPAGPYEIPLVIQDRMFNADGTFHYPVSDIEGVTWIGEYFGDAMLVNGKVWPYLDVEPTLYRFRILNGCNARILTLDLGGVPMWQIGAEGGLFDVSVPMSRLVLAPAERADVLVDFSGAAGARLVMKNMRARKPVSNPAPMLEQVMQFRVATTTSIPSGATSVPSSIVGGRRASLPSPSVTRYITLNEIAAEEPDWMLNIDGLAFEEAGNALDIESGAIEDWVYVNLTGDTHPMHTHLVMFEVVDRTPFDAEAYADEYGGDDGVPGGIDPSPFVTGPPEPPAPEERGWKDTVKANPGYLTRIRAKFELPQGVVAPQTYVHHCHIVEHEDNDMMQAFVVQP